MFTSMSSHAATIQFVNETIKRVNNLKYSPLIYVLSSSEKENVAEYEKGIIR